MARTARAWVSTTTMATEDCSPWPTPVWAASASSRACRAASRVVTTVGCDGRGRAGQLARRRPGQLREDRAARQGLGGGLARRAWR